MLWADYAINVDCFWSSRPYFSGQSILKLAQPALSCASIFALNQWPSAWTVVASRFCVAFCLGSIVFWGYPWAVEWLLLCSQRCCWDYLQMASHIVISYGCLKVWRAVWMLRVGFAPVLMELKWATSAMTVLHINWIYLALPVYYSFHHPRPSLTLPSDYSWLLFPGGRGHAYQRGDQGGDCWGRRGFFWTIVFLIFPCVINIEGRS